MKICLWIFPEADFAAWCELVGSNRTADYQGYLDLIAAVQADQERQGRTVIRVRMTVEQMRAGLAARGLNNTPGNRAAVVAFGHGEHEGKEL